MIFSPHRGHCAMIQDDGIVSTGAGTHSPHPLQVTAKSQRRADGPRDMKWSIGEQKANCLGPFEEANFLVPMRLAGGIGTLKVRLFRASWPTLKTWIRISGKILKRYACVIHRRAEKALIAVFLLLAIFFFLVFEMIDHRVLHRRLSICLGSFQQVFDMYVGIRK